MTANDIIAFYPHCYLAVAWCELFLDSDSDGDETSFDIVRRLEPNISPERFLKVIREMMEGETVGRAEEALEQMGHPEFSRYLSSKLGML